MMLQMFQWLEYVIYKVQQHAQMVLPLITILQLILFYLHYISVNLVQVNAQHAILTKINNNFSVLHVLQDLFMTLLLWTVIQIQISLLVL